MTGARQGYTKTGKSLKAVRRYYALKNANKQRRSPPEDDERQNRDNSDNTRRKKSRPEEKLSKRIAAELRTQQEANERRGVNVTKSTSFNLAPTDRSALPVNVAAMYQPDKQFGGPVFVLDDGAAEPASPERSPKSAKSVRSVKSGKSGKSVSGTNGTIGTAGTAVQAKSTSGTVGRIAVIAPQDSVSPIHSALIGCLIACFVFATVYIITWIYTSVHSSKGNTTQLEPPKAKVQATVSSIKWMAISSIPVLLAVPYWFLKRHQISHAIGSLALMVIGTLSVFVCLIYKVMIEQRPTTEIEQKFYFGLMNPLHFWLSIMYFISLLVSTVFMLKQLIDRVSGQIQDRLHVGKMPNDTQMSMLLSPH